MAYQDLTNQELIKEIEDWVGAVEEADSDLADLLETIAERLEEKK